MTKCVYGRWGIPLLWLVSDLLEARGWWASGLQQHPSGVVVLVTVFVQHDSHRWGTGVC